MVIFLICRQQGNVSIGQFCWPLAIAVKTYNKFYNVYTWYWVNSSSACYNFLLFKLLNIVQNWCIECQSFVKLYSKNIKKTAQVCHYYKVMMKILLIARTDETHLPSLMYKSRSRTLYYSVYRVSHWLLHRVYML